VKAVIALALLERLKRHLEDLPLTVTDCRYRLLYFC
jgi:hypothetical protein